MVLKPTHLMHEGRSDLFKVTRTAPIRGGANPTARFCTNLPGSLWTLPENAPLQFTSVKPFDPENPDELQALVLMRASRRGGLFEPKEVALWSLRTAGSTRQKIILSRSNNLPAFEFDVNKQWTVRPAVAGSSTDPAVLERLRERVADLEAILRGIVKRIS